MEGVDVPILRRIALGDDIEREPVGRTYHRPARFALREELLFGDLFGLGVVTDENDLDVVVFRAQESNHPEEEAARDVFLELSHRSANVHHCYDHGVRFVFDLLFPGLEPQVFFLDRAEFGLAFVARLAADVFEDRSPLVQVRQYAGAANLGELGGLRLDGLLRLLFEEGQLEVFEDQRGDLVNVYLGLVIILARAVPGLTGGLPLLVLAPDDVANLGGAVALADVFALAVIEAEFVLVERAHRHLDRPAAVREDDRLVRDDRAEILFDRFFDALLVAFLVNDAFSLERPIVALD